MAVTFIQRQPGVIHPLLIEIDVPTIGPGGPNDLRHGLREGAKLLLALAQGLLRPLAVGDVNQGMDRAARPALCVPQRSTVAEQVAGRAIVENEIEFKVPHVLTAGGPLGGQFIEPQLAPILEGPEVAWLGFSGRRQRNLGAAWHAATVRLPRGCPSCGVRRGHGR